MEYVQIFFFDLIRNLFSLESGKKLYIYSKP